ncbi:MAG TPA: RagB/SusD family nutrient uptake outer membrane protein, partial [Prolixibacteraceae bacterium]|nr:RagB/SusD family nutrient uptake outer membrane protein [Prolixibacteraceae bacterium]
MKTINYIIAIALSTLMVSCSNDFLEIEPVGVQTDEVFFSTVDGIELGVTGTYASLNACPAGLHNLDMMYLVWGSIASDESEAGGEQGGNDFIDIQDADKGIIKPLESKALSDNFWGYNYKSILRACSVLSGIEKYREDHPDRSGEEEQKLKQFEGEMKFVLGFVHFKMVQVYGGIPIVDHALAASEYYVSRNTIAECLHFAQDQLKIASSILPTKSQFGAQNIGRISKGAAQALLAKVYLYEASYAKNYSSDERFTGCTNTYALALTYADSVIASGEYSLPGLNGETYDTYWSQNASPIYPNGTPGYRYIFTVEGENSGESVFGMQSVNDGLGYMLSRGTYLTVYTTVRNYNETTLGWGFNCPTESMYQAYQDGDIRREVTCGKTGDAIYASTKVGWGVMNCLQSPTNMIGRKFESSPEHYWESKKADGNGPNNFQYIRYADVLLMAAEAAVETGNSAKALSYVNLIRKRARNGASSGVPADLTSVSFEDVVKERQVELALEGHRFFDLVRWNRQEILVEHPLQKYLGGVEQNPILSQFTVGKNDFFPIPEVEVINSNNNLKQYPG